MQFHFFAVCGAGFQLQRGWLQVEEPGGFFRSVMLLACPAQAQLVLHPPPLKRETRLELPSVGANGWWNIAVPKLLPPLLGRARCCRLKGYAHNEKYLETTSYSRNCYLRILLSRCGCRRRPAVDAIGEGSYSRIPKETKCL